MDETIDFLKQKFSEYYKNNELIYPDRFGRREFGFMFFDREGMTRHMGFNTRNEIKNFLVKNAPMHVYYSSAYYEKPDAQTMAQKKWLGADLIFDLDADHIESAKELNYEEMLSVVRDETLKLLKNFILDDFGFDEKYVSVNFSGGRGYHIHVTDPKIFSLDSFARREIVDYVEGIGLENVFMGRAYEAKQYAHKTYVKKPGVEMPKPDEPGWRGKMSRGTYQLCDMLEKIGREKAIKYLTTKKISKKTAEGIYSDLFDKKSRGVDKIKNGTIDVFSKNAYLESFIRIVSEDVKINVGGAADEPVTSDIKRLIRMNSSLHGKTGLKVMPVKIDELKKFNPLNDAIVFSDELVNVEIVKPVKISMCKKNFNLKKGENTVPEFLGVFLIGRGLGVKK
jgi:DNA primase small subunit